MVFIIYLWSQQLYLKKTAANIMFTGDSRGDRTTADDEKFYESADLINV